MEPEILALTLPIRRLVEFLLRTGSIDSRFTGFDRALEGARLHRKLQRAAVKEYPDYQAEAALKQDYTCAGHCLHAGRPRRWHLYRQGWHTDH